jgi:hypothetical protein
MNTFETKLNGTLYGLMQWSAWDRLAVSLREEVAARWYVSATGAAALDRPLDPAELHVLLGEITLLLRNDHREDYLGIVYVDDLEAPSLVKIYDPNNLGASCGSIGFKVPPGWVLSLDRPTPIDAATPLPGNRRRWWEALHQRLLGGASQEQTSTIAR